MQRTLRHPAPAAAAGPASAEPDGAPADPGSPETGSLTWWRWLLIAVSLGFVAYLGWRAGPEIRRAASVIGTIAAPTLITALLLEALAVASLAQVYRASVAAVGSSVTYGQGLQVSMGAFTLSRALPGGGAAGGVWAARQLNRVGLPWSRAGTAVVLEGVLAMATLGGIVAAGTVAAAVGGNGTGRSVVIAIGVALAFALAAAGVMVAMRSAALRARVFDAAGRLLPRLRRRFDGWHRTASEHAEVLPPAHHAGYVVGWSLLNWGLDIAALWVLFNGLGHQLSLGVLIVGFGVANLVTALPHTPGGVGLVEAGMTGVYVALGAETAVALAAVLVYRVISFWLPVLAGIPQYLRPPARGEAAR